MSEATIEVNGSSTPQGRTKAFFKNLGANAEMCASCNKKVYAAERIGTGQLVYHKTCFRCTHCKKPLTLGQYTVGNNQPYCKPHYLRVFKETGGRYDSPKSSEQKNDGSTTGSTPFVVRQRSSANRPDVVSIPQATSPTGASSSFITYRSPSMSDASAESDSVGNVKRLPSFAATRALFENASFATTGSSGTPSEKPVTPSAGYVREMRAKREATSPSSENKSPPPVYSPSKVSESISVTAYSVTVDKEKEQKTADEEIKQEEREIEEQEVEEREQIVVHTADDLIEIHAEDHLDKEQPPTSAAFHVDDSDSKLNDDNNNAAVDADADDRKYYDKDVEEREQEVIHGDEDLIQIHDEDEPDKEYPPTSDAFLEEDNKDGDVADADDDKYFYKDNEDNDVTAQQYQQQKEQQTADEEIKQEEQEVEEREQNVVHTADDLIEIHGEDHLDKEQPPASAAVHVDDSDSKLNDDNNNAAVDADADDRKYYDKDVEETE